MTAAHIGPAGPRTWRCDHAIEGTDIHLRPRNDHIWHPLDPDCPCGPDTLPANDLTPDGLRFWLYVHHALDGRPREMGHHLPTPHPCHGHRGDDDGYCRVAA